MFKRITQLTVLSLALVSASLVSAEGFTPGSVAGKVFGTQYTPVAPVSESQVQVVYYRAQGMGTQQGAAHVYVDREFHAGLLPGGYTTFCVAPGNHALGAYLKEAPRYKGKTTEAFSAMLEGGKTYFLRVNENGNGAPATVARQEAERELSGLRMQVQALSRASTVQACASLPMEQAQFKDYALASDVLFAFGKSGYQDMTSRGHEAVRALAAQLKQDQVKLDHIEVIGHTDPIGSQASNQVLGLKRAQTVRRLLLQSGLSSSSITASSAGSDEPVSQSCEGSRAEQIACYAEDRRVVVRVNTQR